MLSWFKNWKPQSFIKFTLLFNFIYAIFSIVISWKIIFSFKILEDGTYIFEYVFTYIAIYVGLVFYQSYIYSYICRTGILPVLQYNKKQQYKKFILLHIVVGFIIVYVANSIGFLIATVVFNLPVNI